MRPTNAGMALALLCLAAAVLAMFFPKATIWFWAPAALAAAAALVDFVLALRLRPGRFERDFPGVMTMGVRTRVGIKILPPFSKTRLITIFDGIPASFAAPGLPLRLKLGAKERSGESIGVAYFIQPEKRGRFQFVPAWVELQSPLAFWRRRRRAGLSEPVSVYPNYRAIIGDRMFVGGSVGAAAGAHHIRRRGLGLEFHQLREYQQGDMMRTVDVKASSRFGKLIVREMQEEEDQSVLFLLDTGYRMTARDGSRSHFDSAFEAMLSLAYVALKQGDRVAVRSWGPDQRWVPFFRGTAQFPKLVGTFYDVEAIEEASSPVIALSEALSALKRRTFIVLLTNFREEDGEGISNLIPLIGTRHLLCTVWLKEKVAEDLAHRIPENHEQALETVMAMEYVRERERCRRLWESKGVLTLDTVPEKLQARLVEQYWNVKKQGRL